MVPDVHSVIFMPNALLREFSSVVQDEGSTNERSEQDDSRKSLVPRIVVMLTLRSVLKLIHGHELKVEVWVKEFA